AANRARFTNQPLSNLPLLGRLVDQPVPVDGSAGTLKRASAIARDGTAFDVVHAAAWRAAYDVATPGNSRIMLAPGQSGHLFSPHWRDLAEPWAGGSFIALTPPEVPAAQLRLSP